MPTARAPVTEFNPAWQPGSKSSIQKLRLHVLGLLNSSARAKSKSVCRVQAGLGRVNASWGQEMGRVWELPG